MTVTLVKNMIKDVWGREEAEPDRVEYHNSMQVYGQHYKPFIVDGDGEIMSYRAPVDIEILDGFPFSTGYCKIAPQNNDVVLEVSSFVFLEGVEVLGYIRFAVGETEAQFSAIKTSKPADAMITLKMVQGDDHIDGITLTLVFGTES